jgi:CubicO group peptidase (beta-lactamase class C family)
VSNGGLSSARLGRMHDVLVGYVERGEMPGLVTLVSRRGETHVDVIGAKAVGGEPMQRDTIFRIASMSKPITAAATMILVEECKLRLNEAVDELLPELANRKVLKGIDSQIDDTVPADRSITVRDLLTFRMGFGMIMAMPGTYPIQKAIEEQFEAPGPPNPSTHPGPGEWMKRLGALPLIYQPGEKWLYHTGSDVLGVLISRVAGKSFEAFLRERIFEPLGMKDTGFHVSAEKIDRLATSYMRNQATGELDVFDEGAGGQWSCPPAFESGGGGLVSTVDDYLAFCHMMLDKGRHGRERILSRPSVELMTSDQLTPEQKAEASLFFGDNAGWGFGMSVVTRRTDLPLSPGRFGWDGGLGTSGHSDPAEEMVGILMTQKMMDSPQPPPIFVDFWTSVYAAIDD